MAAPTCSYSLIPRGNRGEMKAKTFNRDSPCCFLIHEVMCPCLFSWQTAWVTDSARLRHSINGYLSAVCPSLSHNNCAERFFQAHLWLYSLDLQPWLEMTFLHKHTVQWNIAQLRVLRLAKELLESCGLLWHGVVVLVCQFEFYPKIHGS